MQIYFYLPLSVDYKGGLELANYHYDNYMLYSKRHVASEGRPGGDPWVKENVNPAVLFRPTITCGKSPSVFKGQPGNFPEGFPVYSLFKPGPVGIEMGILR